MWGGGKQDIEGSFKSTDFMWDTEEGFCARE